MYIERRGKIAWFLPCYLRAAHAWTSPVLLCASVSSPVKWGVSKASCQRVTGGLTGIVCAECFQGQLAHSRTHPFTNIIPFTCHNTLENSCCSLLRKLLKEVEWSPQGHPDSQRWSHAAQGASLLLLD